METAIVRQFIDFFQDYINLCQSISWPNDEVSAEELRSAFVISSHIEKCLDKLHKQALATEFLDIVNREISASHLFLTHCLNNPPKYLLKKVIQSKISISKLDVSFKIFMDLFSEERLEDCLSDIMLEKASKETLLHYLPTEISKEEILSFKSQLFMSELSLSENPNKFLQEMLESCNQEIMDMFSKFLLCKDPIYTNVVHSCVNMFLQTMLSKEVSKKMFWKLVFHINEDDFTQICLYHADLFQTVVKALIDSAKLIKENMSAEFFYIDLTYSELVSIVQRISKNDNLKLELLDIVYTSNADLEFWNNIIKL